MAEVYYKTALNLNTLYFSDVGSAIVFCNPSIFYRFEA